MNKEGKINSLFLVSVCLLFFFIIFSFIESIPSAQAYTSGEYAYVPNEETNNVTIINTTTNTVIATVPVGDTPNGIAVNQDGSKVFVTCTGTDDNPGRRYYIIDTDTYNVTFRLVGEGRGYKPLGITITPDETFYIACDVTDKVYAINLANQATIPINVGLHPIEVTSSPDGKWVYVANNGNNSISVINTTTNNVTATVPVGEQPYGVAVSPDGEKVYVTNQNSNNVSIIDTKSNKVIAAVPVGRYPHGIVATPDGKKVYVAHHNKDIGIVYVINATTNQVTAKVNVAGVNLCGVATTHDGNFVYVTATGSKNISGGIFVINTTSNIPKKVVAEAGQTGLGQFIGPISESKLETKTTLSSKSDTLIATVDVSSQTPEKISGKVIFMDGSKEIGNGSDVNSAGQVIFEASSLSNGSHSIIAKYLGNDIFRPSTSSYVTRYIREKDPEKSPLEWIVSFVGISSTFILLITAIINFITSFNNRRK